MHGNFLTVIVCPISLLQLQKRIIAGDLAGFSLATNPLQKHWKIAKEKKEVTRITGGVSHSIVYEVRNNLWNDLWAWIKGLNACIILYN